MATAQHAYRLDTHPDRAPERSRNTTPRVVVTGGRQRQAQQEQAAATSMAIVIAKVAAVLIVVIAALAFGRIALQSAAVTTLIEADAYSTQIAEARSVGVSLEMEQSVLSNTYAINAAAKRLGMSAPVEVGTLALSPDVVVTDADGALSLSGSAQVLAETKA